MSKTRRTQNQVSKNTGYWNSRLLIGTPTTGLVRYEWAAGRWGQVIPTNWSASHMDQRLPLNLYSESYAPLEFLVADAQNLIVKEAVQRKFEWLLLIEQDNVMDPDAFIRFNEYIRRGDVPVVSGLYFTKTVPPEPMIYRDMGHSFYTDWRLGDKVWCSGVPTGTLLIHCSILEKMWEESPEYSIGGQITRRVFDTPEKVWLDYRLGGWQTHVGTSDLFWCNRVITENFFAKAGWGKYQKKKYPFLVDTGIFVKHIDNDGRMWPLEFPEQNRPLPPKPNRS